MQEDMYSLYADTMPFYMGTWATVDLDVNPCGCQGMSVSPLEIWEEKRTKVLN